MPVSTPSSILRNRNGRKREPILLEQDENNCKSQPPSYRLDLECFHLLELEEDYHQDPSKPNLGDLDVPVDVQSTNQENIDVNACLGNKNSKGIMSKNITKIATESTTSCFVRQKRSVQFQSLHIRTYNQVLGDHPCCSSGLPISLGWTYRDETQISINDYEICRLPRRNRWELRLDDMVRRNIIMKADLHDSSPCSSDDDCNSCSSYYSQVDLRKAERKAYRQRNRMTGRRRNSRIASQFFNCPSATVVGAE